MKLPKYSGQPKKPELRLPIFIRRIHGHSMVPVLPPGTYIWANRWYKELKAGDVVVFSHDNKEKIKRISDLKDKEVYLLGDHIETSTDSRHFGWIGKEKIIAKVFWPHAPKTRAEGVESGSQASPDK